MTRPKKLAKTRAVLVYLFPDEYYAARTILLQQKKSFSAFVREAVQRLTKGHTN